MNVQNRVNRAGEDLAEYYSSRQGILQIGATVLTAGGLVLGKTRIAAVGVAIFGFVAFPIAVASNWRSRRDLEAELRRTRVAIKRSGKSQAALPAPKKQFTRLKGRVEKIHGEVLTTRKTMRGLYAFNRQVERRLTRLENANRARR